MSPFDRCLRLSALSLLLHAGLSQAQIFRCEAADGKVEYRAAPCAAADKARRMATPDLDATKAASPGGKLSQDIARPSVTAASESRTSACDELEKRLKANAVTIRDAIDFWHREMTLFGKDSPRTHVIFNKLSNLRVERTMLAQTAYPSCDFARRGNYPQIAAGNPISEAEESGLSADTVRQCDAMRAELVAYRSRTGRYLGAGRPSIWTGEADSPMARELALEDKMNNMRCPQVGPPMSLPR